jgi:sedoheptulokinase
MTIGIDIGTTSISIIVFDNIKNSVAKVINFKNKFFDTDIQLYHRTQDPNFIANKILNICDMILGNYKIEKIGVTGQMHGILYIDTYGNAVSPLYTWQDKSGEVLYSGNSSHREYINEATGDNMVAGIAFGSVTHFYLQCNHKIPENAIKFCTIGDYIVMKLCHNTSPLMHISNAAGIGLYNLVDRKWNWEAMIKIPIDSSYFPEITEGYTMAGYTKNNIPVAVAIGDNQASFLGSVKDMETEILLNFGTGGQISCFSKEIITTSRIETRPLVENNYIVVSTSHCGGRAYAALERFFSLVVKMAGFDTPPLYDVMEKSIENYKETKGNIIVNTTFCGSRDNPKQHGEIRHITLDNFTPENFVYGFLQGIADELYPVFLEFTKKHSIRKIIASGNTVRKNLAFQKLLKKKYDLPLELTVFPEEAACGAAFFSNRIIIP